MGGIRFGPGVYIFRHSGGVGASNKNNASGAAPTVSLTTTKANSSIVMIVSDWNASDGSTRAYRSGAGTLTEKDYYYLNNIYTVYTGYHANSGAVGTYSIGLTTPSAQKYSIVAVEIKGI
jgi:hypothetical protein